MNKKEPPIAGKSNGGLKNKNRFYAPPIFSVDANANDAWTAIFAKAITT